MLSVCYSTPSVPPGWPEPPGSAPVSSCFCPSVWLHLLWWRGFFCAVCARLKIRGGFCVWVLFKQLAWRFVCLLWVQACPLASPRCSRAAFNAPVPRFYLQDSSVQMRERPGGFIEACAMCSVSNLSSSFPQAQRKDWKLVGNLIIHLDRSATWIRRMQQRRQF